MDFQGILNNLPDFFNQIKAFFSKGSSNTTYFGAIVILLVIVLCLYFGKDIYIKIKKLIVFRTSDANPSQSPDALRSILRAIIIILVIILAFSLLFTIVDNDNSIEENDSSSAITCTPTPTPVPLRVVSSSTVFRANASSTKVNLYNHEYRTDASMVVDNNLATAWNEGADGDGIGEWITLSPVDGEDYTYFGFYIANGFQFHTYHKGDRWYKNNRVASLRVYANNSDYVGTFQIPDLYDGYSTIVFSGPIKCKYLMFEIQSVWSGDSFSDTCISEIRPF